MRLRILLFVAICLATYMIHRWFSHRNIFIDDASHRWYIERYETPYQIREAEIEKSVERVLKDSKNKTSIVPLLDEEECALIIFEAERYAKENGWTRKRHENYPTTDLPVSELHRAHALVMSRVYNRIIPIIESAFEFDKECVEVHDVFLIRYTTGGQSALENHQDGSIFSFIIPLNDQYEGGGTEFNGRIIKPKIGEAFVFCGQNFHKGVEVTKGTRYVLAGFLYLLEDE